MKCMKKKRRAIVIDMIDKRKSDILNGNSRGRNPDGFG